MSSSNDEDVPATGPNEEGPRAMDGRNRGHGIDAGDVIEFTLRGERQTAVALLVTDEGAVLVDLLDEDGLAWAEPEVLVDVVVFRPEPSEVAALRQVAA
jgi:hypothetical protein